MRGKDILMAKISIHCYISGRVQGVFYRGTTQKQAQKLGLTGWVRNLPDRRVELVACGSEDKVQALKEWLHRGPTLAKVTAVEVEEVPVESFAGFDVR